MPYTCATWDWESDGYKKGPRPAPTLEGRFGLPGLLRKEEVHASLQSHLRVLLVTYLAVRGPTETPALARELETSMDRIGTKLRGMQRGGLVDCLRVGRGPGKRIGRTPREWWVTETGQWALWRQAWLTRTAVCPAHLPWEVETGVPDDPVEAVRDFVKPEFLRPGSYRALAYLMRTERTSMRDVAIQTGVAPAVMTKRIHMLERRGWVEPVVERTPGLPGQVCWLRRVTDAGNDAMIRHADALRKAALASGWTPYPGAVQYGPGFSQYHYEEEFLDSGWSM